jgi:hypothetical protein
MAGFAIDLGDEGSQFAQGVSAPSANASAAAAQGLQNITQGLFGVADSFARASAKAAPTEASINRQAFGAFIEQLDNLKGVTDPTTIRLRVNTAIAAYESQGFPIGKAEADAIFRRTGRDISASVVNPAIQAADAANKQLLENPGFIYRAEAKLQALGQPFTDQDVAEAALGDMKASEAAATYLVTAKNIDNKDFQETYIPHADRVLEDIRGLAISGLQVEIGGGDISPESLVQLRTKFDIAKAQLTKPKNVSEDNWQHVNSQLTTLDELLTRLETYDSEMLTAQTAAAMEPISQLLLSQAKSLGATDPVLASALLSGKVDWSSYVSTKWDTVVKTLKDTKIEDTVYTSLDVFGIEAATQAAAEGTEVTTTSLHNPDEFELATNRSSSDRLNAITNALDFKLRLTEPVNINQPEHRELFLNGVGQATVNVATATQLISKSTMDSVFSPEVFSKLALVKKLDPEAYQTASLQMRDAIQAQANIFATTMKGVTEDSLFVIAGLGRVELKTEGVAMPRAWTDGSVQAKADQYYGGNIYRMFKDRGAALSASERTELRGKGFPVLALSIKYDDITRANNQFKTYADYFRKAGGDPSKLEALILTGQESDEPVPSEAMTTETRVEQGTIDNPWSVANEEAYTMVPIGAHYRVGTDPTIRIKRGN